MISSNNSDQYIVTIKDLYKTYGKNIIINNISLDIKRGETIVICGRSGAGKSTALRCINGLEEYDGGEIRVNGQLIDRNIDNLNKIRKKIGMVFQDFNLFPHLSVLDNCSLALKVVNKMSENDAKDISISMLQKVNLHHKADIYPYYLSGGEKQRVAIARALCMNVDVMLYDEPTSALDPYNTEEVLEIMKSLSNTGVCSICVTHEMQFAEKASDRVCFMENGEIVEICEPKKFFNNPDTKAVRDFLRMN